MALSSLSAALQWARASLYSPCPMHCAAAFRLSFRLMPGNWEARSLDYTERQRGVAIWKA